GFPDAVIVASNDLDEHTITSLKEQCAAIKVWGVGTRLVTGYEQPALGGVYKLSAIEGAKGWDYKLKLSEHAAKISTPGIHQVRRFHHGGSFVADAIFDAQSPPPREWIVVDPEDPTRRKRVAADAAGEDLLVPVFRNGGLVAPLPDIHQARDRA